MEFAINGVEFSLIEVIVWLVVGAICAGIASALVGYSSGGFFLSAVIGVLGAMIGSWLARQLGLPPLLTFSFGDVRIELLWAIVGAAILVLILAAVRRPIYRRRRAI